jgi:hypothetical protein
MMDMTAKILFEFTKDGALTVEVSGSKAVVKAGLLTIIDSVAEFDGSTTAELLAEFSEASNMLSETSNTKEDFDKIPQEMKDLFDKVFGGLN